MPPRSSAPERIDLAPGLTTSRIMTGLWQIADMERDGKVLDVDKGAAALLDYVRAGFDSFDMADHYGSAEVVAGRLLQRIAREKPKGVERAFVSTKWCPSPGAMTPDVVRAGVERSLGRLGVSTIDLMQFHWWTFEHPGYLDAMTELAALQREGLIRHLGVTNFNTDHLRVLVKHGIPVVSNQVSFSLMDRRAAEDMSQFCIEHGIKLLAYGTLGGGLISERWLGRPEPTASDIADWSKMKYKRFVDAIGGWAVLQGILGALHRVAGKHGVSIANVATRWILDHKAVAAVIVGARLGEREHREDNLRTFAFALDDADRSAIEAAFQGSKRIPGDCGDEYRRPPFLTASGDLSHHLSSVPKVYKAVPADSRPQRLRVDSASIWEALCGYSRAIRIGDRVLVSGTTATDAKGAVVCRGDPAAQTVYILDKIMAALGSLGATLEDVIRTRIYLRDASQWEPVARVHGRYFGRIRPANTLIEVSGLVGDYEVEIEAEAIVG
ncbi:MAG: aldo/keto reductase [Proteobacteria bacterium]|nr:aldo/keto reductase [Pseudomonadota bacterium]MBI3500031.1 aldo/keto reductase [Pseudomonadota bacterium]